MSSSLSIPSLRDDESPMGVDAQFRAFLRDCQREEDRGVVPIPL